jgi:transcriptional regulator with XRE-family HTH domain
MNDPQKLAHQGGPGAAPPSQPPVTEESTSGSADGLDGERRLLAERLRETREFLGISQQEAADTAGLTRLAISAIETGRRKVESVELRALSRVYGQPVAYFLPASDVEAPPEEVQFIARAAKELEPDDRAELLRFAKFLKSYKEPRPTRSPDTGG